VLYCIVLTSAFLRIKMLINRLRISHGVGVVSENLQRNQFPTYAVQTAVHCGSTTAENVKNTAKTAKEPY